MIYAGTIAIKAAMASSATIPKPFLYLLSKKETGKGFRMSKMRKKINAAIAYVVLSN